MLLLALKASKRGRPGKLMQTSLQITGFEQLGTQADQRLPAVRLKNVPVLSLPASVALSVLLPTPVTPAELSFEQLHAAYHAAC